MFIVRNLVLPLMLTLCCLGCSNAPGQQELVKQVIPAINGRILQYALEAKSIKKINGQEVDANTYILYFNCEFLVKDDMSKVFDRFPKTDDLLIDSLKLGPTWQLMLLLEAAETKRNGGTFSDIRSIDPGKIASIDSFARFVRTENGWMLDPESIGLLSDQ